MEFQGNIFVPLFFYSETNIVLAGLFSFPACSLHGELPRRFYV
jgi:hypothetical protein